MSHLKLRHRLSELQLMFLSNTAKNSAVTFVGNFGNNLLALVAVVIVSRELGPSGFGVLATFNAVMVALSGLTDFGLGTTAVKQISENLENDPRKAKATMLVIFKLELFIGASLGIAGIFASSYVADALGGQHLLLAVRLGFFGGAFLSAAAFIGPFLISQKRFILNSVINLSGGILRTGSVLMLLVFAALSLENIMYAYALVPVIFFLIGFWAIPKDFFVHFSKKEKREAFKEVAQFSKWVFLSFIATSLIGKLDIFLLSRLKGTEAVGIYSAAQQLCSPLPMLIGALSTVLLPQLGKLSSKADFNKLLKQISAGSVILIIILLPGLLFGDQLISLVFGNKYSSSFGPFKYLYASYLVALLVNPISLIFYRLNKPYILTYVNYANLILSTLLYLVLIPLYGPSGAAGAFLITTFLAGTCLIALAKSTINKIA